MGTLRRVLTFLRGWRRAYSTPEPSRDLRMLTALAQLIGFAGLAWATRMWWLAIPSALLLVAGHWHAFRVQGKTGLAFKIGLFAAAHLVVAYMCGALLIGLPFPQVQLAFLLTAVVAFDLHSRANLYAGLGLGLLCLYAAATISRDVAFLAFLVAFFGAGLAFLWTADNLNGLRRNPQVLRPLAPAGAPSNRGRRAPIGAMATRFALAAVVLSPVVFMLVPRYAGTPLWRPISLRLPIRQSASSQIINPALPVVQIEGQRSSVGESDYYYGFDSALDLSYRGGLSNTIMMYVRSPAPSYWRSHAYDTYDGRLWTLSDDSVTVLGDLPGESTIYYVVDGRGYEGVLPDPLTPGPEYFVQSFFIAQPMPNLVFVGGRPHDVYIFSESLLMDSTGGLRVGEPLQPGLVYTVVSSRVDVPPEQLRADHQNYPGDIVPRYLQIPAIVGPEVRQLARDLQAGAGATNPYDTAIAIRDHLRTNYPYDWNPPAQPPGSEACYQLLFVDKRGVCEHYVTAMVIMLRELGVPARLAAGYGTGDFNAITGYYEVRANQAHAWVEVYFPTYGWIPLDPTPGWDGSPQTGEIQRWFFSNMASNFRPPEVNIGAVIDVAGPVVGLALAPLAWALALIVLGVTLWGVWQLLRRWQVRRAARYAPWDHPARRRVFRAYKQAQRRLKDKRAAPETVQAHAARHPQALGALADAVDVAAYRPEPPEG